MLLTGPTSTEGKRNQRQYSNQVMCEIEAEERSRIYAQEKYAEQFRNRRLREIFEQFFAEEFANESQVLFVGSKAFEVWRNQVKRIFSLAVKSLRLDMADFPDEIIIRFDNVVTRTYQAVEVEESKTKKQQEREEFKKLFLQAKATK